MARVAGKKRCRIVGLGQDGGVEDGHQEYERLVEAAVAAAEAEAEVGDNGDRDGDYGLQQHGDLSGDEHPALWHLDECFLQGEGDKASNGRDDWTEIATIALLSAWGERYLRLSRGSLRLEDWGEVAKLVSAWSNMPKTDVQCKNRIDTLKKKYKSEKQKQAAIGSYISKWPFYAALDRLSNTAREHGGLPGAVDAGEMIRTSHSWKDCDSDDDDDKDEDGLLPESTEVQILDTLARIKKKDLIIYKPDVKFFEEREDVEENAGRNEEPRKKPVYLKDVIARQALEDPENKEEEEVLKRRLPKTYAEEQQELKDAFLKSVSEADAADGEGEAGLFKIRKKSTEEEQYRADGDGEQKKKDAAISHRLEEYFGKDDDLDEHDKFLKDYLLNQGWIDKEKGKLPSYSEIVGEVSDDEAELEKQDRYEAEYNFRFEEGAGDQVLGHSRFVDNSVRKVPEKRKEQRKKKQERVSEVEQARREELKRLKNVKKKEIFEKISKIKTVAGITSLDKLAEEDLEEDFDPTEYDKKMHDMFGENYYNDEDPDANFQSDEEIQLDKPDFDAEDDALGLPEGWDGRMKVGFAAVHDKQKCSTDKADASKGSSEEKLSVVDKEEIEKKLEEYYKLDYEDMVGDLPTRFKYTQVKPSKFGLSVSQILDAEDTELNRFVSLKALAPYRTEEWVPKHKHHRINKKERKRRALDQIPTIKGKKQKHEKSSEAEPLKKVDNSQQKKQSSEAEPLKKDSEVDNSEQNKESMAGENQKQGTSKKKHKRRKKGLGLSYNRLVSYGKVDMPKRKRRKA